RRARARPPVDGGDRPRGGARALLPDLARLPRRQRSRDGGGRPARARAAGGDRRGRDLLRAQEAHEARERRLGRRRARRRGRDARAARARLAALVDGGRAPRARPGAARRQPPEARARRGASVVRLRAALLSSCAALACGAPAAPIDRPSADAIVDEAGGARIGFLPRATDRRLWLSPGIDAGARDADPPQLATVAAWAAAAAPIEARVLPDGIELARPCARRELEACVRSLADALRARSPSE